MARGLETHRNLSLYFEQAVDAQRCVILVKIIQIACLTAEHSTLDSARRIARSMA